MMQEDTPKRYWFRAKRYGWGWGLPRTLEAWTFLLVWITVTALVARELADTAWAPGFIILMLAILLMVCFMKGEPPRWRWGDKD